MLVQRESLALRAYRTLRACHRGIFRHNSTLGGHQGVNIPQKICPVPIGLQARLYPKWKAFCTVKKPPARCPPLFRTRLTVDLCPIGERYPPELIFVGVFHKDINSPESFISYLKKIQEVPALQTRLREDKVEISCAEGFIC